VSTGSVGSGSVVSSATGAVSSTTGSAGGSVVGVVPQDASATPSMIATIKMDSVLANLLIFFYFSLY
jgi:hypothetical protein